MAEALGLALPGSALMPATSPDLLAYAREAGRQSVRLAKMKNMKPSDLKMQSLYMQQSQEVQTVCFIFRQLHMNLASRSQEIHLTDYTVVHIIFLMYVQQEDGQQKYSIMQAAFQQLWKKLRNISILM